MALVQKKPEVQPNIVEPPREEPTTYDDRKLCQIAEGLGYDRARIVRLTPSEIRYRFDTLYQHNRKEWSGATALGTFTVAATGGILAIGSSVPGSAFAVSSLLAAPLAMPTFLVGSALLLGGGMALGAGYQIFKSWKNRRKADKALQEGGY